MPWQAFLHVNDLESHRLATSDTIIPDWLAALLNATMRVTEDAWLYKVVHP